MIEYSLTQFFKFILKNKKPFFFVTCTQINLAHIHVRKLSVMPIIYINITSFWQSKVMFLYILSVLVIAIKKNIIIAL